MRSDVTVILESKLSRYSLWWRPFLFWPFVTWRIRFFKKDIFLQTVETRKGGVAWKCKGERTNFLAKFPFVSLCWSCFVSSACIFVLLKCTFILRDNNCNFGGFVYQFVIFVLMTWFKKKIGQHLVACENLIWKQKLQVFFSFVLSFFFTISLFPQHLSCRIVSGDDVFLRHVSFLMLKKKLIASFPFPAVGVFLVQTWTKPLLNYIISKWSYCTSMIYQPVLFRRSSARVVPIKTFRQRSTFDRKTDFGSVSKLQKLFKSDKWWKLCPVLEKTWSVISS